MTVTVTSHYLRRYKAARIQNTTNKHRNRNREKENTPPQRPVDQAHVRRNGPTPDSDGWHTYPAYAQLEGECWSVQATAQSVYAPGQGCKSSWHSLCKHTFLFRRQALQRARFDRCNLSLSTQETEVCYLLYYIFLSLLIPSSYIVRYAITGIQSFDSRD